MAAKYIHLTVERIGIGRALSDIKDMTDKIIQFTAGAYQDPSPDVRFWGKKLIILLSQHHGESLDPYTEFYQINFRLR